MFSLQTRRRTSFEPVNPLPPKCNQEYFEGGFADVTLKIDCLTKCSTSKPSHEVLPKCNARFAGS